MKISDIYNTAKETLKKQPPEVTEEELKFDEIFEPIKPLTEQEKLECIKMLRQQGYQIFSQSSGNPNMALNIFIERYQADKLQSLDDQIIYYEAFINEVSLKRTKLSEKVGEINSKKRKHDSELEEYRVKVEVLKDEMTILRKEIVAIRKAFAELWPDIGKQLIENVDEELSRLIEMDKRIAEQTNAIFQQRYSDSSGGVNRLIEKLNKLRASYADRYEILQIRMKHLGGEGINLYIANVLLSLGMALAGVTGFFFAVFCSKDDYSSDDAFSYLLINIFRSTSNTSNDAYIKILYFLSAIGIITLVSWLVYRWTKKMETHTREPEKHDHIELSSDFNSQGFQFSQRIHEKSWFPLWLKVVPIILVIGILILFLSYGADMAGETKRLSAATEGLVIGTTLALGLSAVVYLYLMKVVESRTVGATGHSLIKTNWELVSVLCLFVVTIGMFAFYNEPNNASYSIAAFISSCLLTAFSFAYGLRFYGIVSVMKELEDRILTIDNYIETKSRPERSDLYIHYYHEQLAGHLLFRLAKMKSESRKPKEKYNVMMVKSSNLPKQKILNFYTQTGQKQDIHSVLFEITDWQLEYFPNQAEEIRLLATAYNEKQESLLAAKARLDVLEAEVKQNKLKYESEIATHERLDDKLVRMIVKAKKYIADKRWRIKNEIQSDIVHIKDGFSLGALCRDMGPDETQN